MVSNSDLGFLLATLVAVKQKKKKKKKRRWSKAWYKLRNHFTREHLLNFLCDSEPEDYRNFLRMDQESFNYLLDLVRPDIEKKDTKIRDHRGNVIFYTINSDTNELCRLIAELDDIDWTNGICAGPIHEKFLPMMDKLITENQIVCTLTYHSHVYAISREKALTIKLCVPEGLELRAITLEDVDFVHETWPQKSHNTLAYITDSIRLSPGVALCEKGSRTMLSWCLHSLVGGIGMWMTPAENRGRGYGRIVATAMTRQIAEYGFDPQVQTLGPTCENIFKQIGFDLTFVSHRFFLKKTK